MQLNSKCWVLTKYIEKNQSYCEMSLQNAPYNKIFIETTNAYTEDNMWLLPDLLEYAIINKIIIL